MANKPICAYGPCECEVEHEGDFCSEACRYNAQREVTREAAAECDCGHQTCTAAAP